uniref:CSON010277 protein n=1 Tax=Culicoides sonorensis TaxID=179676 RepID=A0A336KKA5_CULSO
MSHRYGLTQMRVSSTLRYRVLCWRAEGQVLKTFCWCRQDDKCGRESDVRSVCYITVPEAMFCIEITHCKKLSLINGNSW